MRQTVGVGLLLLSGCEVARSARNDFARLMAPSPKATYVRKPAVAPARSNPPSPTTAEASAAATLESDRITATSDAALGATSVALTGYGETELRAMLGAPTSEEEHPPGKQWRYRNGKCTLDIQLYPDVETKKFRTLAYKVKSDDNTDEGNRLCLAQLQSRVQARR